MKNEKTNKILELKLSKELYLQISTDKAAKITALKREKDTVILQIKQNIANLEKFRELLKELKGEIKVAKTTLKQNKKRKWSLKRELSLEKKFAKRINNAYIDGEETVNLSRFYIRDEYNAEQKVEFDLTKELYLKITSDKTVKIANLKEEKDNIVDEIERNINELDDLKKQLETLTSKINKEEDTLTQNKNKKYSLKRELSVQNRFSRKINRAFIRGDESINVAKFYTLEEQKAR